MPARGTAERKGSRKKASRKLSSKKKVDTAVVAEESGDLLKDKVVAFTGKLDRMQCAEAEQLARSACATTMSTINARVDYLVIGADGSTNVPGDKSSKQKKGKPCERKALAFRS